MEWVRRALGGLRRWVSLIPGFRRRNESSMLIAGTYYAVAAALLLWRWSWGLLLLGLPFLLFCAIALYEAAAFHRRLVVLTAFGGALVCLGLGAALAQSLPAGPGTAGTPVVGTAATEVVSPSMGTPNPSPAAALAASTATQSAPPAAAQGAFVASSGGSVYHRADCASAARILEANRVWFGTAAKAEAAGYRPCVKCQPGENGETATTAPTTAPTAVAGTQGAETPATTAEGALVASRNGSVYHRADCASAAHILEANRVYFGTAAEAEAAGYRPCEKCRPDAS